MIGNTSRFTQFQSCREKAYNWDILRLASYRDADPLMIGEAYHIGSEVLTKTGQVEEAVQAAETRFRKRLEGQMILPEELVEIEREIEFVKHATRVWAQHYDNADFRMLWPEVSGLVPLPNSEHHCWFIHKILHPDEPYNSCTDRLCRHPHYFKFRTDGVVEFYHKVWLLEQKTTSSTARNNFWPKWNMNFQVGCYMYGVWRVTGQKPAGVIVNAIIKRMQQDRTRPTGNGGYKLKLNPTDVDFERETFVYTPEMLMSFEADLIRLANEYEAMCVQPKLKVYRNTDSCFNYNRACYYWERCQRKFGGQEVFIDGEFKDRTQDYVEAAYYEVLGLPNPEQKEEPCTATTKTATTKETNSSNSDTSTVPTVESI